MNIHNRGKFHQYGICNCLVKIFKVCVPIQHPRNFPFRKVFGHLLLKVWSNIAKILIRGSTLANKNIENFEGLKLLWKRDGPKVSTFVPTLNSRLTLKMAEIDINKQ